MLALQRELILDIGGELRIRPAPEQQVQVSTVRPVNPEAYDEYLRGRFISTAKTKKVMRLRSKPWSAPLRWTQPLPQPMRNWPRHTFGSSSLFAPGEGQWEEKAFVAVEKALSLDPNLAVAYQARGRMLWTPANHFPHEKAIREYRRALGLDPNLDEARNQLALDLLPHRGF